MDPQEQVQKMIAERRRRYRVKPSIISAFRTPIDIDVLTSVGKMHVVKGDWLILQTGKLARSMTDAAFCETYELA